MQKKNGRSVVVLLRFRAWLKKRQEMDNEINHISWLEDELYCIGDGITYMVSAEDLVLMQSTGLRDELNEELFEGDVILWTYWDEFEDSGRAKIVFKEGMFKLLDVRTGEEVWDNLFDCIENCNVYLQGNIYENPELLEEKKWTQK
nr:MAG TPA: YopX protein [Caudoviricetes sp.]